MHQCVPNEPKAPNSLPPRRSPRLPTPGMLMSLKLGMSPCARAEVASRTAAMITPKNRMVWCRVVWRGGRDRATWRDLETNFLDCERVQGRR